MPAVLDKAPDKFTSAVEEQIAQAAGRIRFHDLALGGLVLVALTLVYATTMIVLDKYLVLPEIARQLGLVGLLTGLGVVGWFTIVRPLTRRVNPLYAAVQVEKTIDDAKNSVVGFVEAQENGQVHPAVKAAMGVRAAKTVIEADVNRAVDHRSLIWAGGVAVAFLLALIALFFIFRPAQFKSLAARAFVPFTAENIASRTQLTLVEPAGGDVTITTGQSITVKVNVGGKVPSPDNPDRLRVLLRHAVTAPDYEEVPLEKGENSREWQVRVPDYLVRNGFWYKVAGGDAETAEHRVTVRTLPLFTDFDVKYDYPAYTRLKGETNHDPHLRAIKGTKVTIVAHTNRTVKDGRLSFDPATREPIAGRIPADRTDSVQFTFVLTASGQYRLVFTSSEGERSPEPPPFKIQVDEDSAPRVDIVKPEEAEITLPANGQLAVDATASDDFGLDKLTLKLRIAEPAPLDLKDKPYQEGKSFRRSEKDGSFSWPTSLDYKDSVDLAKVTDAGGQPVMLKEGMVLEYWLEAADNRTKPGAAGPEADPNIGKSDVKRVRLGPPLVAMEDKKQLDQQKNQRKNEEQKHAANQQQRLDNEKREPGQPMGHQEPKPEEGPKNMGDPGMKEPGTKDPMTKNMGDPAMPPKKENEPSGAPMLKNMDEMNPPMNMGNEMNPKPETAPMPSTPEQPNQDENTRKTAEEIQKKIDEQKGGGSAKPGPANEDERANPAEQKPMPMMGDTPPPDANPKESPKEPMNGMQGSSAESKPMGSPPKPETPAENKAEPRSGDMPMNGNSGASEPKPAPKNMDPMQGPGGMDKPTPPMNMMNPAEGSKPATQQKSDMPMPGMMEQPNPAEGAGQPKPMPSSDPGREKPEPKPMSGASPQDPKNPPQDGGMAKPQSGPPPADTKPAPKDMTDPMPGMGTSETKPASGDMPMIGKPDPGETKPDMTKPDMMGAVPPKGADKGVPQEKPQPGSGNNTQNPTPEQQKEFEQALKDLASKDPAKQDAARKKLDDMVGEKNRKDIEHQMKDFEKATQDLNSKDDKTKKDAQDKLDKMVGEKNRKDIENIQKGLNSNDPKERAAAEEKLKDLQQKAGADKADQQPKKEPGAGDKKVDPREVEKALDDAGSDDPKKREEAKKKLDEALGKGAGDKAEKAAEKAKNDKDLNEQAQGRKERDELLNKAEEMAKQPDGPPEPKKGGKELTPEEREKLAKTLNDLNSKDEQARKQAEDELDKQIGKQNREKLQEAMKDPKKAEDLKSELKKWNQGGGDPTAPVREALKEDARNRARSAQLQLENFEKNKNNKELLDDLGMTPEQYSDFLKKFREHAEKLQKEADDLEKADLSPKGSATTNVSEGRKIESKGAAGTGNAGGPTYAAPGYADALKKFREDASKTLPKK
jgi:hypothetical protein